MCKLKFKWGYILIPFTIIGAILWTMLAILGFIAFIEPLMESFWNFCVDAGEGVFK